MSRADVFAEEQKKREEQKNNQGYTPPDYEDIDYVALETDKVKVFRFIGNPFSVRQENSDPKLVLTSRIIDDKGKLFTCRWSEDKNWILWKIYNDVLKFTWDKNAINPETGKPGVKVFTNAIKFPTLFQRVRYNGKENPNSMEKGWYPTRSVMMNCICRDDYAWHAENKSYKLIAKKANEVENDKGEKVTYYEPGIGTSTYDAIIKAVVEEHGAWEDFDIAIRKEDADPWYSVYSFFDARKIAKDLTCEMNGDALTEEELTWKKFDIDKLTQVTGYRKIKNRLGDFIKQVDGDLKTNYFAQLEKLAADEQAEWDEKNKGEQDTAMVDQAKPEEKKEDKAPQTRTRQATTNDVWSKMKNAGWKAVDKFKEELGDSVKDVEFGKTNQDIYMKIEVNGDILPKDALLECPDCHTSGPDSVNFCPVCGCEFK